MERRGRARVSERSMFAEGGYSALLFFALYPPSAAERRRALPRSGAARAGAERAELAARFSVSGTADVGKARRGLTAFSAVPAHLVELACYLIFQALLKQAGSAGLFQQCPPTRWLWEIPPTVLFKKRRPCPSARKARQVKGPGTNERGHKYTGFRARGTRGGNPQVLPVSSED